jgi:hypothetical protein
MPTPKSLDYSNLHRRWHFGHLKNFALAWLGATGLFLLVVAQKPSLDITSDSVILDDSQPQPAQALTISNPGLGPLTWNASSNAPWLSVEPKEGTLGTGSSCTIKVAADTALVPSGDNIAELRFNCSDGKLHQVRVEFNVSPDNQKARLKVGQQVAFYHDKVPPYARDNDGTPFNLTNNPDASQPTWAELEQFLKDDPTQLEPYVLGKHDCSAFAEELHNRAEARGISAAIVVVRFDDGNLHALDAFFTQDRGLVFVDDTGSGERDDPDKIAYIKIGREYGLVDMDLASNPDYTFYESYCDRLSSYKALVTDFNNLVAEYNNEESQAPQARQPAVNLAKDRAPQKFNTSREVFNLKRDPVPESYLAGRQIQEDQEKLEVLEEQIGGIVWFPMGVVSEVEVYW